jgi:hypothetical protein
MATKDFIEFTPNSGGSGSTSINVTTSSNSGAERNTVLNISGGRISKSVSINQKEEISINGNITINKIDSYNGMSSCKQLRVNILVGESISSLQSIGFVTQIQGVKPETPKSLSFTGKVSQTMCRFVVVVNNFSYGGSVTDADGKIGKIYIFKNGIEFLSRETTIKNRGVTNTASFQFIVFDKGEYHEEDYYDIYIEVYS